LDTLRLCLHHHGFRFPVARHTFHTRYTFTHTVFWFHLYVYIYVYSCSFHLVAVYSFHTRPHYGGLYLVARTCGCCLAFRCFASARTATVYICRHRHCPIHRLPFAFLLHTARTSSCLHADTFLHVYTAAHYTALVYAFVAQAHAHPSVDTATFTRTFGFFGHTSAHHFVGSCICLVCLHCYCVSSTFTQTLLPSVLWFALRFACYRFAHISVWVYARFYCLHYILNLRSTLRAFYHVPRYRAPPRRLGLWIFVSTPFTAHACLFRFRTTFRLCRSTFTGYVCLPLSSYTTTRFVLPHFLDLQRYAAALHARCPTPVAVELHGYGYHHLLRVTTSPPDTLPLHIVLLPPRFYRTLTRSPGWDLSLVHVGPLRLPDVCHTFTTHAATGLPFTHVLTTFWVVLVLYLRYHGSYLLPGTFHLTWDVPHTQVLFHPLTFTHTAFWFLLHRFAFTVHAPTLPGSVLRLRYFTPFGCSHVCRLHILRSTHVSFRFAFTHTSLSSTHVHCLHMVHMPFHPFAHLLPPASHAFLVLPRIRFTQVSPGLDLASSPLQFYTASHTGFYFYTAFAALRRVHTGFTVCVYTDAAVAHPVYRVAYTVLPHHTTPAYTHTWFTHLGRTLHMPLLRFRVYTLPHATAGSFVHVYLYMPVHWTRSCGFSPTHAPFGRISLPTCLWFRAFLAYILPTPRWTRSRVHHAHLRAPHARLRRYAHNTTPHTAAAHVHTTFTRGLCLIHHYAGSLYCTFTFTFRYLSRSFCHGFTAILVYHTFRFFGFFTLHCRTHVALVCGLRDFYTHLFCSTFWFCIATHYAPSHLCLTARLPFAHAMVLRDATTCTTGSVRRCGFSFAVWITPHLCGFLYYRHRHTVHSLPLCTAVCTRNFLV